MIETDMFEVYCERMMKLIALVVAAILALTVFFFIERDSILKYFSLNAVQVLETEKGLPAHFPTKIEEVPEVVRKAYENYSSIITRLGYCHSETTLLYFVDYENILYGEKVFYSKLGRYLASNTGSEWSSKENVNLANYSCVKILQKESKR